MKAHEVFGLILFGIWLFSLQVLMFGMYGYGDIKEHACAAVIFAVVSFIKIDKDK